MDTAKLLTDLLTAIPGLIKNPIMSAVGIFLSLIGIVVIKRMFHKWNVERVRRDQAQDEIKEEKKVSEEQPKQNDELKEDQDTVDDWAEKVRKSRKNGSN